MESDWIKIHECNDLVSAELLRQQLQQSDIQAIVLNKKDSSYFLSNAGIELYVHQSNVEEAKNLIIV
ncbi:hypothetical protein FACS189452_05710 [Bacteroidia bacterium]|nr:hypothetical protein FACS189452_05710 [Bacteroidia bacterium]GHT81829.1 hypothetical protein FACS189467_6490 [Bacteroidia bacterium]